jgi:hypothetical protein
MVITAIIDRVEDGNAILLSEEAGIEISVPIDVIEGMYREGERISLTIDRNGNIKNLK